MAPILLLLVLSSVPIQSLFAFNCLSANYGKIMNCDQCIKCGGYWCISPGPGEAHCSRTKFAEYKCKSYDEKEIFPFFQQEKSTGDKKSKINPTYVKDSIKISQEKTETFSVYVECKDEDTKCCPQIKTEPKDYNGSRPEIGFRKDGRKPCKPNTHTTYNMEIKVDSGFCTESGGLFQNFTVPLEVDGETKAKADFSVVCECKCSQNVSVDDARCNHHGNFSCGVCSCDEDWIGTYCDQKKPFDEQEYVEPTTYDECPSVRGDVNCIHDMRPNVECSGNGRCEDCCLCDQNKVGWQYFDWTNYCEDICMTTNTILDKDENVTGIYMLPYDEEKSLKKDSKHRKIWVKCEEMVNDCVWTYYARKNVKGQIAVMVSEKACPNADAVIGGVNVTALVVPIAVLAALVMAGVGYAVWHSKGAAPLSAGNYQGLDGPRTRVETNPTYIEPIKSYKNPTYGQQV